MNMDISINVLLMPLISALVPLIIAILFAISSKKQKIDHIFNYPKVFAIMSSITLFICLFGLIMFIKTDDGNVRVRIFVLISVPLFAIISIWMLLYSLNCLINLQDTHIIHRNIFRMSKKYDYTEITKIVACYAKGAAKPEEYAIYIGKRRITVTCFMKNFNEFERIIKKRLKAAGNPIKIEEKRKR